MADMRALFTQRFDAARAALTQGDEPAAAESLHWAIVAARTDPNLRRELASALFHLGKLSRKFGRAGEAEAEQLLSESLSISEGLFGAEHAALVPVLNELSKLHVQRSQHARAEEALERLLAIARAGGEENADVAIALAGLAAVKHRLGQDILAEGLFREALRIREKVLEPNHMVTVVTLEQLAETCAALGNFVEALALYQRALLTREATLGPGHATVHASRSRIAELQLQVAIEADATAVAKARAARGPIPTPAFIKRTPDTAKAPATPTPPDSEELEFLGEPEPKVARRAPLPRERAKTPAVAAAVAAASLMAAPLRTPSASQVVIPPPESAQPSANVTGGESGTAPSDLILADIAFADFAMPEVAIGDVARSDEDSSVALVLADPPEPQRKKRTLLYASAGLAAAAVIAISALMMRPKAGGGSNPVATKQAGAPRTATETAPVVNTAATKSGSAPTGAVALVSAMRADSPRSESATPTPTAPAAQPEKRAGETAAPELRAPRIDIHLNSVNIASMPAAPNVDSAVRSSAERQRAADTERAATKAAPPVAASADVDEAPPTPPKIVGRVPVPRFPNELLRSNRTEGQVVVRFLVNDRGQVDMGTIMVLQSDHDLFTEAVRNVLPNFRFEPARTHAPESKPVAGWVTVPFRFVAKK